MLDVTLIFQEVWPWYKAKDGNYLQYLSNEDEWNKLVIVYDFLKKFNNISKVVFEIDYPITNLYFIEVFRIKNILIDREFDLVVA